VKRALFLYVRDSETYRNDTGYFFASDSEAIAYAEVMARELGHKEDLNGSSLVVMDEHGRLLRELAIHFEISRSLRIKRDLCAKA
jgi:hypothetical protein